MKKVFSLVLVLLLISSVCACGAPAASEPAAEASAPATPSEAAEASEPAAEEETWLFGYANHRSDENSNVQMQAFVDAAVAWNEAGNTPRIETTTTTAESDMQRQLADIDSMLAMGVKGIVIQGVDPVGIVPAIEACIAQDVKVVEVRGANVEGIVNLKVGDEEIMGEYMYEYLAAMLDADPDLMLKAGLQYGNAAQTAQLVRVDNCVALLKENYGDRIEVLASQPCDWDMALGQACMENWLQQYQGEMNCIIAAAGMMATGACNALVAAGESMDDWTFVTVDATAEVLESIYEGQVDMTVGIDVVEAGTNVFNFLVQYVQGEIEAGTFADNPMTVIDSSNIADWYGATEAGGHQADASETDAAA